MSLDHKIHILVPFFNAKQFLSICLDSIVSQKYSNYSCYLWDDGSTDNSKNICNKYINLYPNIFRYYRNAVNLGPAASKYYGLKTIQEHSSPNDIVLIIDGDDHLIDLNAFQIINNRYLDTKCWFTYGGCVGKWCDQGDNPPNNNFRNEKWRYTHPRSFKAGLISYFTKQEFKIDGTWLLKGTDRPLIFSCLELAGNNRVQFINTPLYNYRSHPNNTLLKLDKDTIKNHTQHVNQQKPKEYLEEKIHIVMCSWKRPHNIFKIINNLDAQTVSKKICLHIINNNIRHQNHFINLTPKNITINIAQRDNSNFAFERFLYTKQLLKTILLDYIIFIDDDEYFDIDYIERLYEKKQPQSMITWFGKCFDSRNIEYWQNLKHNANLPYFDYGGTGGCIIDTNIFNESSEIWNLPSIDLPIKKMEDLWLSYVMSLYNWKIKNSNLKPHMFNDKITMNNALWKSLKEEKQKYLEYLILERKWDLLNNS